MYKRQSVMFEKVLSDINKKCRNTNDSDYIKDGLIYCGKCNTPKQCRVKSALIDCLAYCMCHCEQEKYENELRNLETVSYTHLSFDSSYSQLFVFNSNMKCITNKIFPNK